MTGNDPDIFDKLRLSPELDAYLRGTNPWWTDKPGRVLPSYQRWAFAALLRKLESRIAPVVVLRGARQVGKTTIQEQVIERLREDGVEPRRILRVQFDEIPSLKRLQEPILSIVRWYENRILGSTLNEAAHSGKPSLILFDEVQNLASWAPQIKALVDHHSVQVVVTGSSALRIEAGRDSLAGRITTLELGPLLLREIAGLTLGDAPPPLLPQNGLEPLLDQATWRRLELHGREYAELRDTAFTAFSERGGYPFVHANPDASWPEIADQLNETVIRRVIRHDLRMGDRGQKRDEHLLEEVFRLACRYAGQAPGQAHLLSEIKRVMGTDVGPQRLRSYLEFLNGALLVRLVRPLELRLKKIRGNSKMCILDHGLRASWLEEVVPLDPIRLASSVHLADLAGHLAESVVGAFLAGIPNLDVSHFPERSTEPEIDFVITIGEHRIPLEVKYRRRIDPHRDTTGIRTFLEKTAYNAPFGVLVTLDEGVELPDPRIVAVSLRSLLLLR